MGVRLAPIAGLLLALLAPASAVAQGGTGSISGKVTDGQGDASAQFCVVVDSLSDPAGGRALVVPDGGAYAATGLAPGGYTVEFRGCGAFDGYAPEFWDDATAPQAATVIQLADGEARAGIDAVMDRGSTVSGRVTDAAGNPLEGICVEGSNRAGPVRTDASGRYTAKGFDPEGTDWLDFTDCARPDSDFLRESRLVEIPERAEHVTGFDAVLARGARIAGRVTDFEGEPVANACVSVYRNPLAIPGPVGSIWFGWTDADGRYAAGPLIDGRYLVGFQPCLLGRDPPPPIQYFREQASPETANLVEVAGTRSVTGIDARIVEGGRPCVVPDVTGKTLRRARRLIGDTHCEVGRIRGGSKPAGRVAGQAPDGNTMRPREAKVKLRVR